LNQKYLILEQSYEIALQNMQTLRNRNQNLLVEQTKQQKKFWELLETEKEREAQITRLMSKLSGWAVSVASTEGEWSSSESDKESEVFEEDSLPKIIPDECVPGFLLDESSLSRDERTIKPKRLRRDELKYSYRAIPTIPGGSVLKQIFEIGRRFVHPDQTKKLIEVPKKSYPRPIDRLPRGLGKDNASLRPVKKDQTMGEDELEPWQLPDPEVTTRSVKATVFEKLHVEGELEEG